MCHFIYSCSQQQTNQLSADSFRTDVYWFILTNHTEEKADNWHMLYVIIRTKSLLARTQICPVSWQDHPEYKYQARFHSCRTDRPLPFYLRQPSDESYFFSVYTLCSHCWDLSRLKKKKKIRLSSRMNKVGGGHLMRNANLLIAHIYSIPVDINRNPNVAMWQVFYTLADSGWREGDIIIWEYITTDSSESKHGLPLLNPRA